MASQRVVRCVIVDDNHEFLATAAGVLERGGISVIGVASTADEAMNASAVLRPDVILVDVDLGGEDGFELAARLHLQGASAVVLTSTHAQQDLAELVADSSAAGFVQKAELSAAAIQTLLDDHG